MGCKDQRSGGKITELSCFAEMSCDLALQNRTFFFYFFSAELREEQ